MASGNSSMDGSINNDTMSRSYGGGSGERGRDRDYDTMKQQCEKTTSELQLLRRQHSETVRRCEHTMKDLEYYRGQHHAAMTQLEAAAAETSTLRNKYADLATDKQRLERELSDMRAHHQDGNLAEAGNTDTINQHFMTMRSKYEAVKEEYDSLRKRYDDLITSHSSTVDKLELAQEEMGRMKKKCEEMIQERNVAIRERNGLKQQCTAAIRQWDIALRERNEYQEALTKVNLTVQQQHEEAVKEINQAMAVRMKANKDLKRLTEERNAAMQEYSLVMSERDSVHKEMEKLTEDLTQAYKKCKALEMQTKEMMDEKTALTYHMETLKREIQSALHDRDKALKECYDLQERFGEFTAKEESQREGYKSRFEYAYNRERDVGVKDPHELQPTTMDLLGKCHKERMDNLDQANQELDKLRKHADKLQAELQEALQEAEVSKRRRDWAFSERDKIVLERESIRSLCDRLRRERDRAVSDLAEALRDSDDIKKQRNETTKELNVLKEKMEAQLEKESRMLQLHATSHNYSHDSAIDTDLQEWDTEVLDIDLGDLASDEDLGLDLIGGRDDPQYPNDSGIYVSRVAKGSILDGKLRPNDCIIRVNNLDCSSVSKRVVLETVRSSGGTAIIVVRRRRVGGRTLYTTQLNNYEHGLTLETGIYISKISPGSLAAKEGNLAVGDRVLSINNKTMDGLKSARDAMAILHEPSDVLMITTLKWGSGSGSMDYKKTLHASTQTESLLRDNMNPVQVRYSPKHDAPPVFKWSRRANNKCTVNRNSSPVTFEQEQVDAIAELDSVIESYHPRIHRREKKNIEKNGGTWPKARVGPVIEHATGTIVHPRKNKERLPLSVLLNNSPSYTLPPCCNEQSRRSVMTPSDASIDLSVKSGNIGKELLEYYVKKRPKYPTTEAESSAEHSRIHSQLYGSPHYPFTPFLHSHPPHSHTTPPLRYPLPSSQSGDSVNSRSFSFEPSFTQFHHTHSPSVDSHYHKNARSIPSAHSHPGYEHENYTYEGGTFPRKKENQRFRIPSNPSVTSKSSGGKVSTGSIEKASDRGSPMPTFHVEVLSPGLRQNKRNSLPDYTWSHHKPSPGELRRVHIDKSVEPLGIQISCLEKSGGVFVSTVSEHSLASQVGLQVGDQLLEVCGINMRSATYQLAASVLRQCGNSITMLVQYAPDKYQELEGATSSSSGGHTRSGSPTPRNSPRTTRKSATAQLTQHQLTQAITTIQRQHHTAERGDDGVKSPVYDPRYLMIETHKCSNLGISLVGGNAVGIFVHSVQVNSLAYNSGLRTGDQILEYNGTDLRQATAEEAAYELAKPADKVTVLAQYNIDRYNDIKDKPGDSFYIRALFDRLDEVTDSLQLRFRKDDVLYVDNTMFNGVPGHWRAWLVDEDGNRQQCGIIPSKYKVEEELLRRRSLGDLEGDARRATRRSFFRRKKHQRSDSKELASFSNINLGWYSDSGTLNEDTALSSYQRVTRLNAEPVYRPVLIVGPLSDCVTEKLIQDFPDVFTRLIPEVMHCSQATMEKGISDNLFVDYRKKGSFFECTSVSAIKDIMCDKRCHCVIDIALSSVERLHRHQVYPIVLLIKFKSTKQIKEVKDTRYPPDKVTAKAAKEMYEHALKLESEYKHHISAVIPAGVNVAYMCTQIKAAVDMEQNKTLWVPCPDRSTI
ncbi:disks large homolog 5-like isoform X2 [Macrosteles quadrilineatus]|uniref:disks large homolog 5-like isoform X2 n=1 Tax=Macrosteles quadrilineatus TaxID=74068 RepID=UPI0023E0B7C7|nr:disks large homolog 5-like isoform X2 [Macrosteles quadrilineatus]